MGKINIMAQLTIAIDPSSSLTKAFYTVNGGYSPELIVMEPEVVPVNDHLIEQLQQTSFKASDPTDTAYIEVDGKQYAVGWMAKQRLLAMAKLSLLKFEEAIYKVLALVGAIATRKDLGTSFNCAIAILLPVGEYSDRVRLKGILQKALAHFKFRGESISVTLTAFNCLPEGAGLLLKGVDSRTSAQLERVAIIMVGYRNASFLLTQRGQMVRGVTTPYGMIRLVELVESGTSGLSAAQLIGPIYQAGASVKQTPLKSLVQTRTPQLRSAETKSLQQVVKAAREQYWELLSDWLSGLQIPSVDVLILAGGTASYYQTELEKMYSRHSISWGDRLEKQLRKNLGEQIERQQLQWRLTDIFGYFYWVHSVLKQTESLASL